MNVRELQNTVERVLILSSGKHLQFPALGDSPETPEGLSPVKQSATLLTMDQVIANHIRRFLITWAGGSKGTAAQPKFFG